MTGTLLTTLEVAERLGISSWAVAQAVRSGALQPAARTNDDFLFTERSVAAFAERRAEAAATPLAPPAAVSRTEWSGDLDRLNSWLKDLNESIPATAHPTDTVALSMPAPPAAEPEPQIAAPIAAPEEALPAVDFTPPPRPPTQASATAEPEPPAAGEPEPLPESAGAPVAAPDREPEPPPPIEPGPFLTPTLVPEPAAAEPAPASVAEPVAAELATAWEPEAVGEPHLPTAAEATAPLPEPVAALRSGFSRQAVLVVEPIERFRILRDVADRLATVPGIADARLERLEGGLASYRLSFGDVRPSGAAIASALAPLGLQVMLVDSQ